MNGIYSFWVKEWLALDVVFLAVFYALRVLVGGAASTTMVSEWLLSFSIFFFFGLAMVKRFSEIKRQPHLSIAGPVGRRAYGHQDLMTVLIMGITTSIVSILVLALYLSTGEVQKLYRNPGVLWLVTPLLLFWLNRFWLLGARGEITEDPVVFAIRDKVTWVVIFIVLCLVLKAI
jgi:4-hydroxybenzoate polyprenyltransferase